MSNRVVSLSVDQNFFLSPNYTGYQVLEPDAPLETPLGNSIFVLGDGELLPHKDEFVGLFEKYEEGTCPLLPSGEYDIKLGFTPETEKITITFNNLSTGKIEAEFDFDPKKYLLDYFAAFNQKTAGGRTKLSDKKTEEFEYSFSKKYFKNTFREVLKGNEAFWDRFHGDFDLATQPMNIHFDRQMRRDSPKKVVHLTHAESLQVREKFDL